MPWILCFTSSALLCPISFDYRNITAQVQQGKVCQRLVKAEDWPEWPKQMSCNLNNLHHLIPILSQAWPQTVLMGNNCWIWPTADIIVFKTSRRKINTHTHLCFFFFPSYTFGALKHFFLAMQFIFVHSHYILFSSKPSREGTASAYYMEMENNSLNVYYTVPWSKSPQKF